MCCTVCLLLDIKAFSVLGSSSCSQKLSEITVKWQACILSTILFVQLLSHVWLFATLWTVAHHTLLSMQFSRQEYWRGLPFPSPGNLPDPGIKPEPLASPAWADRFFTSAPPGKPHRIFYHKKIWLKQKSLFYFFKLVAITESPPENSQELKRK